MREFDYIAVSTVGEAVELLATKGALPLAGGTDLIVQLRRGARAPSLLVDVKGIPDLALVSHTDSGTTLGAAVSCARVRDDKIMRSRYPALSEAAGLVGGSAIQNRATIGGNLCNAAPSADTVPPLIIHDAICEVAGPAGRRSVPAGDFCTGPGRTTLAAGELLSSIRLPPPAVGSAGAYLRFTPRREMDIAVVGVGVWVRIQDDLIAEARIVLGAVGPTAIVAGDGAAALVGSMPTEEAYLEAGRLSASEARPIDDMRGSRDERLRLVATLTARAARRAVDRAKGQRDE